MQGGQKTAPTQSIRPVRCDIPGPARMHPLSVASTTCSGGVCADRPNHTKGSILMYERILIATDGSELSDKAVQHALGLAKLTGATLLALKVVPRYPRSYLEGGVTEDVAEIRRIETLWSDEAQQALDAIVNSGRALHVNVQTLVVKSDLIAETIMAAAEEHKANLIVMASHGRKGLKRLLLGSETQHVLTHSSTPVLVLR